MISLEPLTLAVAEAVLAYGPLPLSHAPDWPHEDTYDAVRPFAEHGGHPGTFLILLDGVVIGDCGWFGPADEDGEVEIGYGLAPSARGQGHAAAAVRLLIDWVRTQGARSVRAEVLPGNEPSWKLLQRLGFERIGERAGHDLWVLS